ncbi:MAG: hypothetical protein EPN93_13805 [Spirochaetes bacterium]|nr:MAG: hypothetical protein EPN93_13805 [Spirochaetota bacterium]
MKPFPAAIATASLAALLTCVNPASVDTPDNLCSGIHARDVAGTCHGAHNIVPAGYCTEANCHASDLKGGNTGAPSCYRCHGPYWEILALHTKSAFGQRHYKDLCTAASFVTSCGDTVTCHGNTLAGLNGYLKSPACDSCHFMPTADGANCEIISAHTQKIDGKPHGADVCNSLLTCQDAYCHGGSLMGATNPADATHPFVGKSCNRCHGIPGGAGCGD